METDLSTVLSDNPETGNIEYPAADAANGAHTISPEKEGGGAPLVEELSNGGGHTEYRRAKSPPSYSSSSARLRTPYERPPADTSYRSSDSGGGGGDHPARDTSVSAHRSKGSNGGGFSSKYSAGKRTDPRPSKRECRVYVGNLAYEVGWQDLKDFMRKCGEVLFADILTQAGGRSKGCGVVEFQTPEEAQRAIKELNDTTFMGRPVFVREDREQEAKFGSGPASRGDRYSGRETSGGPRGPPPSDSGGRMVYVGNLPYIVAWQDLKDLFRAAGTVVRSDIMEGPDRRSKGTGTVLFETVNEAQNAISMFEGYEWHGRRLEVREYYGGGGGGGGGGGHMMGGRMPYPGHGGGRDHYGDPGYDRPYYGRPFDPYYGRPFDPYYGEGYAGGRGGYPPRGIPGYGGGGPGYGSGGYGGDRQHPFY